MNGVVICGSLLMRTGQLTDTIYLIVLVDRDDRLNTDELHSQWTT
jgi:hypothetical protein